MQSPTPPTAAAAATYTTIPISGSDVIFRSIQNLRSFLSGHRPWPEFIASGVFERPGSISGAGDRIRKNSKYFLINYSILISACAALSLIGSPISLLVFAVLLSLWLILYFFREDPLVVSDRVVLVGLVLLSWASIWFMGFYMNLLVGVGVGLLISIVHGVLRNPEGLFLDEDEALSRGLIGSASPSHIDT